MKIRLTVSAELTHDFSIPEGTPQADIRKAVSEYINKNPKLLLSEEWLRPATINTKDVFFQPIDETEGSSIKAEHQCCGGHCH